MNKIAKILHDGLRDGWMEEQTAAVIEGAAMRAASAHLKQNLGAALGKEVKPEAIKQAAEIMRPVVHSAIELADSYSAKNPMPIAGGKFQTALVPDETAQSNFSRALSAMPEKVQAVMRHALQSALHEAHEAVADAQFHEINKGKRR